MKKISNVLLALVSAMREGRNAPCMFMPQQATLYESIMIMYFEYIDIEKSDMLIIQALIREFIKLGLLNTSPILYHTYSLDTLTFYDVYLTTSDNETFCRGTSINKNEAYAKAFGEMFERTSLRFNTSKETIIKSSTELEKEKIPHIKITDFPQPTELQKKTYLDSIVTKSDTFLWVPAKNLKTSQISYTPSQTIFSFNKNFTHKEKVIIQSSSHGSGAGYTEQKAITSGICEIINRHYFLESWYAGVTPPRIDPHTLPPNRTASRIVHDLESRGFSINLLDYSSSAGIPSVIAIITRNGGWSCGGTSGLQMEHVIERALSEAFSSYLWSKQLTVRSGNLYNDKDIDAVQSGFIDEFYGNSYARIMLFTHQHFVRRSPLYTKMLSGKILPYTSIYDKDTTLDIVTHACKLFGDVYYFKSDKEYLKNYKYHASKIIIPKSYFFSLSEKYSRPVLGTTYPQNTLINPFP